MTSKVKRQDIQDRPDRPDRPAADIASVVEELCGGHWGAAAFLDRQPCRRPLPSRDEVVRQVDVLKAVLFPGYFGSSQVSPENLSFHVGALLDGLSRELEGQIAAGLCFVCTDSHNCNASQQRARKITAQFLARLPKVRELLTTDVQAAFEGDPAAVNLDEAIYCYPGVLATIVYRLAHELHRLDVPLIPRMMTEHAHAHTGIDIHPGAQIGHSFFIDHGTGVVIGATCEIGDRVRLYQGVTLGAKSFPKRAGGTLIKGKKRHPIVGDDVIVYAGSTILGRVTVGEGSVIGGNVWLTHSVGPGSRVTQARAHEESFEAGGGI